VSADGERKDADRAASDKASESELAHARRLLSATAIRALAEDRWQRHRPWLDWPVLALCIALLAVVFGPGGLSTHTIPPLDSIATKTVRAERDLLIEDKEATAQRRATAAAQVQPVFDFDPELYAGMAQHVMRAVQNMAQRKRENAGDTTQRRLAFQQELGLKDIGQSIRPATFEAIEAVAEPNDLATAMTYFLDLALDKLVVADRGLLPSQGSITLRNIRHDAAPMQADAATVLDVGQLRRLMWSKAGEAPYGSARSVQRFIIDVVPQLVRPNLTPNTAATDKARKLAAQQAEPVYVRVAAGEVVIREGDRVTPAVQERIRIINESAARHTMWGETAAFGLLVTGLVLLAGWYFRRKRHPNWPSRKEAYLTLSVATVSGLVCIAVYLAGRGLVDTLSLNRAAAGFLPPVALVSLLVAVLVGARATLLAGVVLSLLMAYRVEGHVLLASYYMIGILLGGLTGRKCRRRADLMRAGLTIGMVQAALAPVVVLLADGALHFSALAVAAAAFLSGVLAAIAATGLLPLFEQLFEETTDMRLIELASSDNPLLKQLALQSPGTFYHSVMMSNLAEAAGDVIGANGLQCRVMALYHDLGKMLRPSYFAENQRGGNVHDRLPPELSARIIFAHIKDGIDIARKHRLGRPILNAITQHQGTTLLRVFYLKALERAKATGDQVDEAEFRYPGPRPRTRESGVLLLADSVEAATRALKDPSPADLTERIHKVVAEKLADRQLDDCELTMRDIARIEAAFVRVLTLGVYHSRIEYPPMPQPAGDGGKQQDGAADRHHDRLRGLGERAS